MVERGGAGAERVGGGAPHLVRLPGHQLDEVVQGAVHARAEEAAGIGERERLLFHGEQALCGEDPQEAVEGVGVHAELGGEVRRGSGPVRKGVGYADLAHGDDRLGHDVAHDLPAHPLVGLTHDVVTLVRVGNSGASTAVRR